MNDRGLRINPRYDGLLVALLVLAPAVLAASRDLDWFDGPELALAAVKGGVAHPPGEPLHTLLGLLLQHLAPAYFGVTLASVLPLCLLALPVVYLADRLHPPQTSRARLLRAAVIAAALLCPPLFETGTRVEVYCLAALFSFGAVALSAAPRPLGAGVLLGFSACANPAFGVFAGAAVFLVLVRSVRSLAWAFVGGLLGLLPYLYLPWAGQHAERFVFGAPTRLAGFVDIVLLRAYQRNISFSVSHTLASLFTLKAMVVPAVLALLIGGIGLWYSRSRGLSLALFVLGFLHLFSLMLNKALPHNPDLHGYLIPTVIVSAIGLAALLGPLQTAGRRGLLPLALLLPVVSLVSDGPWIRARVGGSHALRTLADAYFTEAPPRAIVLLVTDHLYFPMLYRQEAEGARPDVVLINLGLAGNAWFWEHQRARHPELAGLMAADLPPAQQLARLIRQSPDHPVVAQASVLLRGLGRGACEGAFLISVAPPTGSCPPTEEAARLAVLGQLAEQVRGDWIGERVVATQAIMLAVESRSNGALSRSARTLLAASRELAALADGPPVQRPGNERLRRLPLRRLPEDALTSPDWMLYLLGRTLVDLGDSRGEDLLVTARGRGVAEAAADLQAAGQ